MVGFGATRSGRAAPSRAACAPGAAQPKMNAASANASRQLRAGGGIRRGASRAACAEPRVRTQPWPVLKRRTVVRKSALSTPADAALVRRSSLAGIPREERSARMALQIGDTAPDFQAETTEGPLSFHDWIGDSWAVLFSHPKDFTPICTTELGYMAQIKPEFDKRGVKIIGLSVDPVERHSGWLDGAHETQALRTT